MFERLKLSLMRVLFTLIIRVRWRGKLTTDLSSRDDRVAVEGGSFKVRIYTPQGQGPFPLMVYYHGGGWVGGNIDTHDCVCRDLCSQSRHVVVSVDYRLAPEHPFPIPATDSIAALLWVRDHASMLNGDPDRLVVCGDSAGGNLAAVVSIHARAAWPGLIKAQVLIYPVTDNSSSPWPSYAEYGSGKHTLTAKGVKSLWKLYLRNSPLLGAGETTHDLATPLHVADLGGLPPAFVLTAEYDVLRDEGLAYAERLSEAGVATRHTRYAGQQHGFVGAEGPTAAYRQAIGDIVDWLAAVDR